MKLILSIAGFFFATVPVFAQDVATPIPMQPERWYAQDGRASFITHKGIPALLVTPDPGRLFAAEGQVVLNDFAFTEGTISFDVELTDFFLCAIYFRRENAEDAEVFYLRSYRAGDPTGPDAIQYTALTKGVALWDLHPQYQASAHIKKGDWNHIKLVISGKRMQVYVNDMARPALTIPELAGAAHTGSIAFEGGGIFANLVVTPGTPTAFPSTAAYDPVAGDPRYLHQWEITDAFELPPGQELVSAMLLRAHSNHYPTDSTDWQPVTSERDGLINLSRHFGRSDKRRAVWLKKTVHSKKTQIHTLNLGFSDEVWVLLNGQLVHVDKNLYSHPIMKNAFGQITPDDASLTLPLQEGENELLIGVANSFFGWAIMAHWENTDGLRW